MPIDNWKDELRNAWWEIEASRPRTNPLDNLDFTLYPYLNISCTYIEEERILSRRFVRITTRGPNTPWKPKVTVWNSGSAPSWSCHVEVLEEPGGKLKAREIIWLQAQETAQVTLDVTTGAEGTSLRAVCYDPVFDPLEPDVTSGRKSTPLAVVMAMRSRRIRIQPWLPAVRRFRRPW